MLHSEVKQQLGEKKKFKNITILTSPDDYPNSDLLFGSASRASENEILSFWAIDCVPIDEHPPDCFDKPNHHVVLTNTLTKESRRLDIEKSSTMYMTDHGYMTPIVFNYGDGTRRLMYRGYHGTLHVWQLHQNDSLTLISNTLATYQYAPLGYSDDL